MPRISKILVSLLAGIVLFLSLPLPAFAQAQTTTTAPWYSQDLGTWYAKVYNPANPNEIFGERYTAAQVNWVFWGFVSFALNLATGFNPVISGCVVTVVTGNAGTCTTQVLNSLKSTNAQFKIGDNGKSKSVFAQIFQEDRTLSGITSIRDLGRKFHIVPVAKAQTPGFGYTAALGIIPDIQNAWNQIRDVSYAIFVFVIIIFAFMIMFRIKISPQVIISVQSALPKIAIALVLVTFSYAIAGFLIDIMYVVIGIMALIFSKFAVAGVDFGSAGNTVAGYFDLFTKGPIFLGISTGVFGLMIMYLVNYFLAYILLVVLGFLSGFISTGGLGGSVVAVFAFIIGFIGLILVLIIGIINFFKITIMLGKTFLMIILLTIFAPLQITMGIVVPSLGFGNWVKAYIAKLAVFPVVGVLFVLALWLLQLALGTVNVDPGKFPQGWPPLLGGTPQLVGLGFLLASIAAFAMIPKAADMVEGFFSGKFNFGSAIGESIDPLGIGRFGVGVGKEAIGTYIGQELYNPKEGTGIIPGFRDSWKKRGTKSMEETDQVG